MAENVKDNVKNCKDEKVDQDECKECEETSVEVENTEDKMADKEKEYMDQIMRLKAEFDNFRRRTIKEKEAIFADVRNETVKAFLPIIDNLERALSSTEDTDAALYKGVNMVIKQMEQILSNLGIEPIVAVGEQFNHDLHNAVEHIDDENVTENTIVAEFTRGFIAGDKVIRHSIVKVAN